MKIILAFLLVFAGVALAQDASVSTTTTMVSATPGVAPVVTVPAGTTPLTLSGGLVKWVADHGGPQAAILFLIFSVFTGLSAARQILYKYDGINPGDPIPADMKGLTLVNKICVFLGGILDFMTGNTKH